MGVAELLAGLVEADLVGDSGADQSAERVRGGSIEVGEVHEGGTQPGARMLLGRTPLPAVRGETGSSGLVYFERSRRCMSIFAT